MPVGSGWCPQVGLLRVGRPVSRGHRPIVRAENGGPRSGGDLLPNQEQQQQHEGWRQRRYRGGQQGDRQQKERQQWAEGGEGSARQQSGQQARQGQRGAAEGARAGPGATQQRHQHRQAPPAGAQAIPVVRSHGSASSTFFSASTFQEAGASEEVAAALSSLGIRRPSHIQAAAYRALLSGGSGVRHVLLADHAGSGKTLAYLLPLLQLLREEERFLGRAATQPRCPRLLVVVPTAELAAQAGRVCRALSRAGFPFRSAAVTGGHPMRTQRELLEAGVDVLVGTPGRLLELITSGSLSLEFCRAVVLDEVDVLLSSALAFSEQVRPLHAAASETTRFVFVSATVPKDLYLELEEEFPGLAAALGPGLHRTAPGSTQQLVDCSGGEEVSEETGWQRKAEALLAVLQERRAPRTMVFCNKIESCRKLENYLNRTLGQGGAIDVLPHHAAIAPERRQANLQRFLVASGSSRRGPMAWHAAQAEQQLVLVCTDRASRGLDAGCDHVVLFDFPRDPSEYLRRVGRTARGGGAGLVTVLVLGRQVKLANDIIQRTEQGFPIHAVPATMPAPS